MEVSVSGSIEQPWSSNPDDVSSARPTPVFRDERILANGPAKDCAEVSCAKHRSDI